MVFSLVCSVQASEPQPDFRKVIQSQDHHWRFRLSNTVKTSALLERTGSFAAKWGEAGIRSFITSLVFISMEEIRKKIHERNLTPTHESVQQVSREVAENIVASGQVKYKFADAFIMFLPSEVSSVATSQIARSLSWVTGVATEKLDWASLQAIHNLFNNSMFVSVLTSFITSAFVSIGLGLGKDFLQVSGRFVMEHPEHFGQLSEKEMESLVLLQSNFGISYFFDGYFRGGPVTQKVYGKVFSAMNLILRNDHTLRETVWNHMRRETIYNGKNMATIMTVVSTSALNTKLTESLNLKDAGRLRRNAVTLAASMAMGMAAAFAPASLYDGGTYYLRMTRARFSKNGITEDNRLTSRILHLDDAPRFLVHLQNELDQREKERSFTAGYYISLMKLAVDRSETIVLEKDQLEKLEREQPGFSDRWKNSYKEIALHFFAGDNGGYQERLSKHENQLQKYQTYFEGASQELARVYKKDSEFFGNLAARLPDGARKELLKIESRNLNLIANYVAYLTTILRQGNPLLPLQSGLSNDYRAARWKLDQYSFWGLEESSVILNAANRN